LKILIDPESKSCLYGWKVEEQQASKYCHPFIRLEETNATYSGLAWINARCPPKPLYRSPPSAQQGRGNMMKGSRVEIRTGRGHSPVTVTDKTD